MRDESTYLTHAVEAIDAIADYTADGQKAFFSDGKTQDAVIRNIGQADRTQGVGPVGPADQRLRRTGWLRWWLARR